MLKVIKQIGLFLWCLPQNIVGLFVLIFTKIQKAKTSKYNGAFLTFWKYNSGVSLGWFVFVPKQASENFIKHEYGHYRDSNRFGPLYLFVIGLPSLCWALSFKKYRIKHNKSYYDFYTERRANKLGGVE